MILAITNQKGGVGKTTTVLNVGVFLAQKGKKVLLVDIDPQSNLTSGIGLGQDENRKTTYDFLVNNIDFKKVITPTRVENLHIAPSGMELAGAEVELVSTLSRENILKRGLESVHKEYDYVLIDCPPSLGLLTVNGLVAAHQVLIPVQSEYFALEGLGQLINTIKLVKESLNPSMDIGGVVLTMYDSRTNLSRDVAAEMTNSEYLKDKIFQTIIPRNIRLSEAPSRGLSVQEYAPFSAGAFAYEQLAEEIINRFERGIKKIMVRPNLAKQ